MWLVFLIVTLLPSYLHAIVFRGNNGRRQDETDSYPLGSANVE